MAERMLLVATDGSPASVAAVDAALDLAGPMQARVRFVHASSPAAEELFDRYPQDGPTPEQITAADPVLAAAASRAAEKGVACEVELIAAEHSANLAATIAGIASGIGASIIVTGSRGRGAVAGAVLGSVSHNLIKEASIPVLVVHGHDS